MPKGDPFTALCQFAASADSRVVADLHAHTTTSDGDLTPSQLVRIAQNAKIEALAITDHDTVAGFAIAAVVAAMQGLARLELVCGVEISADCAGRETHILGLFVDPHHKQLLAALNETCTARRERFRKFVAVLATRGMVLDAGLVNATEQGAVSLGRRHLAGLLLRAGLVRNRFEAFQRHLQPLAEVVPPFHLMPGSTAIELIRNAGGIAVLAHPGERFQQTEIGKLVEMGLQGLEVHFPAANLSRTQELKRIARHFGLACTGGTDLHARTDRELGSVGLTRTEWLALKSHLGEM